MPNLCSFSKGQRFHCPPIPCSAALNKLMEHYGAEHSARNQQPLFTLWSAGLNHRVFWLRTFRRICYPEDESIRYVRNIVNHLQDILQVLQFPCQLSFCQMRHFPCALSRAAAVGHLRQENQRAAIGICECSDLNKQHQHKYYLHFRPDFSITSHSNLRQYSGLSSQKISE
jgi:hypothetical protein